METTQKITPNLWFDGNAREAVEFYASVFPQGEITGSSTYPLEGLADFQKDLAGKDLTVDFRLDDYAFTAINAGPEFTFNPSTSFMLNFDPSRDQDAESHLDELWAKLADGGTVLMELRDYPFSKRYGWLQDRYGLSWQFILTNPAGEPRPFIVPSLMFGAGVVNRAEEAVAFYTGIFDDAEPGTLARYPEQTGPARAGSLMFADFTLAGQWFAAMDSGVEQDFTFNEAVSFSIACQDQAEIDYFWGKLSHVPEAEQCGWCKDKFGVSWQVVPANMAECMARPDAFAHMMEMKKLVIADF
jgi:predicted 3-demethylubiquinone-9 3-methyltransferase (glyoxalase superfamily)